MANYGVRDNWSYFDWPISKQAPHNCYIGKQFFITKVFTATSDFNRRLINRSLQEK